MADPAPLHRFLEAQELSYATALNEIRQGAKRSHWMWFIFPQLSALGRSATAKYYGIHSASEAREYLEHPLLGFRYVECAEALQCLATPDPVEVFGSIDAMKLRSSLTLFEAVQPSRLFADVIGRFYANERDPITLRLLRTG